jgi:hypothetical protein
VRRAEDGGEESARDRLTSRSAGDGNGARAMWGTLCERTRLGTPSATGTATTTGRCPPPCPTPAVGTGAAARAEGRERGAVYEPAGSGGARPVARRAPGAHAGPRLAPDSSVDFTEVQKCVAAKGGARVCHLPVPRPIHPCPPPRHPHGSAATRSPRLRARRGTAALRVDGPVRVAGTPPSPPGGCRAPAAAIRAALSR